MTPATTLPPVRPPWPARVLAALHPASIAANIPGPIFHKEIWVAGRRSGPYWIRGLYAAGLLALVGFVFIVSLLESDSDHPAQRLQQLQQLAPIVTAAIIWFQQVALSLAAILLASPTVCDEKRAGTLGTLLTTPLRAWQIVLGKLSGLCVQLLVLALIAAPLLLAIRVFGGVTADVVLQSAALWVTTALLAAMLGVLQSVNAKRSPTAAAGALALFLLACFGGPLLFWAVTSFAGAAPRILPSGIASWIAPAANLDPSWVLRSSPVFALGSTTVALVDGGGIPFSNGKEWLWAAGVNLTLTLLAFIVASLRLRSVMRTEGASGAPIPKASKRGRSKAGAPRDGAVPPPLPAKSARTLSRDVGDSPVLWRESRQPVFKSRRQLWIAILAPSLLLLWVYWQIGWHDLDESGLHFTLLGICTAVSLIIAIFASSTPISGEKESRTWEVLLTTPLSATEIVRGKFWGMIRRQWFVPSILLSHLFLMAVLGKISPPIVLQAAAILACGIGGVTATGVMYSTLIGRSVRAAAANFFTWMGVLAALPMFAGILEGIVRGPGDPFITVALFPNPVGMMIVAGTGNIVRQNWSQEYDFYGIGQVGLVAYMMLLAVFALLYAAITFGALRIAARRIARSTARRLD